MKILLTLGLVVLSSVVHAADCDTGGDRSYALDAVYTADYLANVQGGQRRAGAYVDNLDLTASVDGGSALGMPDTCLFAYVLYNNGARFSDRIVGDAQVASNIETDVPAVRLYEAWIDRRYADDHISVRVGLYDLNSEFDVVDTGQLFINSAQGIETSFSQTGLNGPSIFPATSLAVRGEFDITGSLLVRTVILDAVPGDPRHPGITTIKLGQGALMVAEAEYLKRALRGVFGYWRYSEPFTDIGNGIRRTGNGGWYALVESISTQGFSLFARAGHAPGAFNTFDASFAAGIVYTGLLSGGDDKLGFAVAWAHAGDPYRTLNNSDRHEVDYELSWQVPLGEHVMLQPDVQYIVNPGIDPKLSNALIFGIRTVIRFGD